MSKSFLTLQSGVSDLPGVGPAVAEKLNKKGLFQLKDLLFLLPNRYQDKTQMNYLDQVEVGDYAQLLVRVSHSKIQYGQKRSLVIHAEDGHGEVIIKLFHFSKAQQASFLAGQLLIIYGQLSYFNHQYSMIHPEYKLVTDSIKIDLPETLTPVYPTFAGIGVLRLTGWIKAALACLNKEKLLDFSADFLEQNQLTTLKEALSYLHYPPKGVDIESILDPNNPYLTRVVLDEFLARQIVMIKKRQQVQKEIACACFISDERQNQFLEKLPFTLTDAQSRVIQDTFGDLAKATPMQRLIQGDVGSGKTVVAFSACLQAIQNGLQTVLMAPTEILAEQHFKQAQKLFEGLPIQVVWLSGKMKAKPRRESILAIGEGRAQLVIGTHAVFQEDVHYHSLGLVVIDEQHRFGVDQRLMLREKAKPTGKSPHILMMTATPIPRTLAMSFYADLDTSVIDELPPNRKAVKTALVADSRREELLERVKSICEQGQQAYWVCALIEESDLLEAQAAEVLYEEISEQLKGINIGLLHGRQKTADKEAVMQDFLQNKIQLLVSTTVIEVGVDVPNASLMVIENAERFGLSQLHQLRGRVGRGAEASFCVLLFKSPLSEVAKRRLNIIRETSDGFKIAEEDLKIRGAGEVLGTRQTGEMSFRIADLDRDSHILAKANTMVREIIQNDPEMAEEILSRWVGKAADYLNV